MTLRESLQKISSENNLTKLARGDDIVEPAGLLEQLPESLLQKQVYVQPGLYIAEINEGGYLGQVLFRFAGTS
jgi:hypothetical protein